MFSSVKHIHFVGIGGIGMSGIAEILLSQGFTVSGSDMARSDNTDYLQSLGATIHIGHAADNIIGAEVVVYSSAVSPDANPETIAAMQLKVPVIRRAEMLAEVSRLNYCLAVAGTHGKTTTTSMAGLVLMNADIDPTVIVGGRLRGLGGSNARLGKGQWTVVEADEYDRSFLQLMPTIAVVTNIEAEHLDIYSDIDDIKRTFIEFVNKVPFYGAVVACMDDAGVREIMQSINKKVITYGFSPHSNVRAVNATYAERTAECTVFAFGKEVGTLRLNIPGRHNISNALAAVAVALQLGIPFETIAHALAEFHGVLRRFEILGERDGILVVDDYAHHHTEVQATLKAAKSGWKRRVVAVFQPHTYTRTRDFVKEFARSFDDADEVIVTDVYASREKLIEGITGELIANAIRNSGHRHVRYVPDKAAIAELLPSILQSGDMLITLGAGDINKAGKAFLNKDSSS